MSGRARSGIVGAMNPTIDPGAQIGHVHLKVADLDRALAFYRDVLGFTVTGRIGDQLAFLAAGGYHHHIGLNTLESANGTPPAPTHTGLYHAAIRYPTREALATALKQIRASGYPVSHGSDHGASESIYLSDPDGNGIELYWDRPLEEWPRTADGALALVNLPLDLESLSR
jgi:catechol 2,3-dioxygenase